MIIHPTQSPEVEILAVELMRVMAGRQAKARLLGVIWQSLMDARAQMVSAGMLTTDEIAKVDHAIWLLGRVAKE